jgi:hypothetical protein
MFLAMYTLGQRLGAIIGVNLNYSLYDHRATVQFTGDKMYADAML